MADRQTATLELCQGPEGKCLYLNDHRIAGPKPWGGGTIISTWTVRISDINHALRKDESHG